MKTILILLLFIAFTCVFADKLEVVFVNVGQGDCILIKAPNGLKILIDAGSASDADARTNSYDNICKALQECGISTNSPLDYLIVTHFHGDHYDYIDDVVAGFGLPKIAVIDRGGNNKWSDSKLVPITSKYLDAVQSKRQIMNPGESIDLGDGAFLRLLACGYPDYSANKKVKLWNRDDISVAGDENVKSLVFVLSWNGFDVLLGGDCEEAVEEALVPVLLQNKIQIDVYKVHHHGSETASCSEFLKTLLPEVSICSTGHAAAYQHPRIEAYDRIFQFRSFIFQTNLGYSGNLSYSEPLPSYGLLARGNIVVTYDGAMKYTVKTPQAEYSYNKDE